MSRFPSLSTLPTKRRHWVTKVRLAAWRPYSRPRPLKSGAWSRRVWPYSYASPTKPAYCLRSRNPQSVDLEKFISEMLDQWLASVVKCGCGREARHKLFSFVKGWRAHGELASFSRPSSAHGP